MFLTCLWTVGFGLRGFCCVLGVGKMFGSVIGVVQSLLGRGLIAQDQGHDLPSGARVAKLHVLENGCCAIVVSVGTAKSAHHIGCAFAVLRTIANPLC